MTKPARCTDPRRAQRGDALLEALVGILLLALLGLGLSHAAARMLAAQRYAAAHGIVVAQMRNALETQGIADLCITPPAGSTLPATTVDSVVTRMTLSTPDDESSSARALLGPGSLVLSQ